MLEFKWRARTPSSAACTAGQYELEAWVDGRWMVRWREAGKLRYITWEQQVIGENELDARRRAQAAVLSIITPEQIKNNGTSST
jgi:hypothetical protein